jgi:hypothetical protein
MDFIIKQALPRKNGCGRKDDNRTCKSSKAEIVGVGMYKCVQKEEEK